LGGGYEDILLTIKPGFTVSQMIDEWIQHQEEIKTEQQKPEDQS